MPHDDLLSFDDFPSSELEMLTALGDSVVDGVPTAISVRSSPNAEDRIELPPRFAEFIKVTLLLLRDGANVKVFREDPDLSPNDIAGLLGISRPLVVSHMKRGDLPFRYVGSHRRARLSDVLAFKDMMGPQRHHPREPAETAGRGGL